MRLTLNGSERDFSAAATLADLWAAESPDPSATRGCAIALNGRVVRADAWAQTPVAEGDSVEIVRAFAGG